MNIVTPYHVRCTISLKMEVQREATPWILMTCVSLAETWTIKKEC